MSKCFNILIFLWVSGGLLSHAKVVDSICYLNSFKPEEFPWTQADCLNFEEVFKNYQYFEAKWNEKAAKLVVRKFENQKFNDPQSFQYINNKLKHIEEKK